MTASQEPLREDEFVLRRVHKNHYSGGPARAVHLAAFRPTREDTTGLSVFREASVTAEQVAASGRKPGEYAVVRLAVRDLTRLGLSLVPEEVPGGPPGHTVVPELSLAAYEADKQRLKDTLLELARLATQAVVLEPEP